MKGKIKSGIKKRWIVVLLLILLAAAFAGCQQQGGESGKAGGGAGTQVGQASEQKQTQEQQGIDLSKYKTLADLMKLGKGVYCEGTQNVNGMTVEYKYWVKSGNMRAEIEQNGEKVVAIVRDGDTYFSSKDLKQSGCDWLMIPKGENEQNQPVQTQEKEEYTQPEKVDISKFNCREYPVSDNMFQTPGKVCSIQEMIKQYMKNTQNR